MRFTVLIRFLHRSVRDSVTQAVPRSQDLSNFGHVLSVGDANGDGKLDLIVGCPYARGNTPGGLRSIL